MVKCKRNQANDNFITPGAFCNPFIINLWLQYREKKNWMHDWQSKVFHWIIKHGTCSRPLRQEFEPKHNLSEKCRGFKIWLPVLAQAHWGATRSSGLIHKHPQINHVSIFSPSIRFKWPWVFSSPSSRAINSIAALSIAMRDVRVGMWWKMSFFFLHTTGRSCDLMILTDVCTVNLMQVTNPLIIYKENNMLSMQIAVTFHAAAYPLCIFV